MNTLLEAMGTNGNISNPKTDIKPNKTVEPPIRDVKGVKDVGKFSKHNDGASMPNNTETPISSKKSIDDQTARNSSSKISDLNRNYLDRLTKQLQSWEAMIETERAKFGKELGSLQDELKGNGESWQDIPPTLRQLVDQIGTASSESFEAMKKQALVAKESVVHLMHSTKDKINEIIK